MPSTKQPMQGWHLFNRPTEMYIYYIDGVSHASVNLSNGADRRFIGRVYTGGICDLFYFDTLEEAKIKLEAIVALEGND